MTAVSTAGDASGPAAAIERALAALSTGEDAAAALASLEQSLLAESPAAVASAIERFLASGRNADTGLDLRVAEGGALESAPTLRVALLDWLGLIDPERAAQASLAVLDRRTSPDEWAVALRNLVWSGDAYEFVVRDRTEALLRDTAWSQEPSTGYLEAFDLVVHGQSLHLVDELAAWIGRGDAPELRWAAFLTLDRLVIASPARTLAALLEVPAIGDEPVVRASLFARADLREADQRAVVERYLRADDVGPEEIETFARRFPLHSRALGPRLVTREEVPGITEQARLDRAALRTLEDWIAEDELADRRAALQLARARLESRVESARRGGVL
ncbi:MAG: hypothetical protein ACQGVK_01160 [Myxococcota bacterium]